MIPLLVRAQAPLSGKETGHQNYMGVIDTHLYGAEIKRDTSSRSPMVIFDRGSLVVKVTDTWLACYEFESGTAEDPSRRGAMHIKFVESSNIHPLVWRGRRGSASSAVVLVT
ncbi:hypothetical protein TNCV_4160871 [Trichonephila clavipes]|nr:hypothetical protein TNCV_4160871 [Trichonephila clavipes]